MRRHALALLATAFCALPPAQAAETLIGSFTASTLQVVAGGSVDFEVGYGLLTSARRDGGNDPNEPSPMEGYQEWVRNWYVTDVETPMWITVNAAGQGFTDTPMPAVEGGSLTGTWRFTLQFPDAGRFEVIAGGDWSVQRMSESGSEVASRYCTSSGDPEYGVTLSCDSWSLQYPHMQDFGTYGGTLNTLTLQVEVQQAVPEPGTLALWLAGAGVLAWRARRARAVR